jgi:hypothetical protein
MVLVPLFDLKLLTEVAAGGRRNFKSAALKRFPPDLNRRDSQEVKDERVFVH